jgi:hypothetical protein
MRATIQKLTTVTTSPWVMVDNRADVVNIGFGVSVVGGTATYNVEHTFDQVLVGQEGYTASPTVFQHSSVTAQTTNKDGNYAFPIRAYRLNVTAVSGATVTLTGIQAGGRG